VFSELGRRGYRLARQVAVAVIGGTVLLVGLIMFVTPGPALLVVPLGLAILALEFAWARNWLQRLKDKLGPEQLNGYLNKARNFGRTPKPPPGDP